MNYQKVYMNQIHSSSLLCQLAQMWRSQLLCDALICTGNVVTKAHRVVLLAACPMLQSMENASIGTELEVRLAADIKQEAVNTFLQYLYEGFMLLTEDNVKHVEKVARLLQVDSVIKCCSDFFKCLEKSTGKMHNGNYKFDKYDLLEFRHVRATGLQKTYHERLMKRISESSHSPSPTGGKRQRMQRPPSPTDFTSQKTDDARTMTQSYMSAMPSGASTGGASSVRSATSSRSDSPSVVEIIEDSLELIQREKPGPGQPEPSRLTQQKTSISVASHVSNAKDTRVVSIADDSGGGRTWTTDSFSDNLHGLPATSLPHSQQISALPKIPFRETHQAKATHQQLSSTFMPSRIPSNQISFSSSSQPSLPPLQQAATLNIAPLSQSFSQSEQSSSESRPSQISSDSPAFLTSTPQRSLPPPAKLSYATGSASQQPPSSQQQDKEDKTEKGDGDSSRPPEGHDPGPSESSQDMTDLAIVKIEKVEDDTGGLLMQVDNGQGDGQRHYSVEDYDDSDLTGDFSQDDMSNEASLLQGDPSGAGAMYMGPTSDLLLSDNTPKRRCYDINNLKLAVDAVKNKTMSRSRACEFYGVPRTTVYDWIARERREKQAKLNRQIQEIVKTDPTLIRYTPMSHLIDQSEGNHDPTLMKYTPMSHLLDQSDPTLMRFPPDHHQSETMSMYMEKKWNPETLGKYNTLVGAEKDRKESKKQDESIVNKCVGETALSDVMVMRNLSGAVKSPDRLNSGKMYMHIDRTLEQETEERERTEQS